MENHHPRDTGFRQEGHEKKCHPVCHTHVGRQQELPLGLFHHRERGSEQCLDRLPQQNSDGHAQDEYRLLAGVTAMTTFRVQHFSNLLGSANTLDDAGQPRVMFPDDPGDGSHWHLLGEPRCLQSPWLISPLDLLRSHHGFPGRHLLAGRNLDAWGDVATALESRPFSDRCLGAHGHPCPDLHIGIDLCLRSD